MTSMLLNSVILILQETLEAALLISMLLAVSHQLLRRTLWLVLGLLAGLFLSILYASQMRAISEWFDYVGQEVVNALLQILITLLIVVCVWAFFKCQRATAPEGGSLKPGHQLLFRWSASGAVALAVTREGSEIFLYLSGFFHQSEYFQPVMIGTFLGSGIGVSVGTLLFYGVLNLPQTLRLRVPVFFLALFAGNMLSQAALQLIQADWISSGRALWDSSAWLPENSVVGQLLYAFAGYEATPSGIQIIAYFAGLILVIAAGIAGNRSVQHG
jgi:high-affinity iron transporter